ncbi:HD domain-containing protein [Marinospirillum celere]|uniref:HD domain-containing protein n=1 Tax=Marinospirillum celere TaxID=1122252 RepID=A0A1I1JJF3_9GAMM|nr:PilZ domain-containing protein [Marinospirillum celere]SFC48082.1 HD domain-containing protein [Marinospirillum celere]
MPGSRKISDQLTGIQARRALDEARLAGGLKIQPQEKEGEPAAEPTLISHLRVNREEARLEVRVQGSEEQMTFLARWKLFVLFIKYRNQHHESNPLEVIKLLPEKEAMTLHLQLPKYFSKVFYREFFRVYLDARLTILFRWQGAGMTLSGRLLDLSAGGCQVAMPFQLALNLVRPLPEWMQITLEFPNEEILRLEAELSYLKPDETFTQALVGWHFMPADSEQERKLFHYTLEAERELARLKHPGRSNLHASRLFRPAPKKEVKPAGKRLHPAFALVPKSYASQLQEIADQLAGQVLLLAARKPLDSAHMGKLARQFIHLLEEDTSACLLALEQPHRNIHRVFLHTFRVAARCFPLIFKVGITRRYELPAMVSLLLHDLGKLFLGHQPCFNPLKEPQPVLRQLKINQIQLLRSASELRWIPKDLGESLMVNANERLDGSGYPRGLTATRLDALSRLMGVVKVLDCLVHGYNDPVRSWQEAYQWVYKHDHWFDKNSLNTFVTHHGLRPVGSYLHYKTGKTALVSRVSDRGQLEEVVLINKQDAEGRILDGRLLSGGELQALGSPVNEKARLEFNPLKSS